MDKKELAVRKHGCGYNCAQSVVCAFADELGVDEQLLYKLSEGLGAGMGNGQNACGALSGAILVAGMLNSDGDLVNPGSTKRDTYKKVGELKKAFEEKVGAINCFEIKGAAMTSCPDCIRAGVEILQEINSEG